MKHLLKLLDLTEGEIIDILNLADQLKYEKKHNIAHRHLEGKSQFEIVKLSLIFSYSHQIGKHLTRMSKIHRGEEITADVMDEHPEIFDEAENRLHAILLPSPIKVNLRLSNSPLYSLIVIKSAST